MKSVREQLEFRRKMRLNQEYGKFGISETYLRGGSVTFILDSLMVYPNPYCEVYYKYPKSLLGKLDDG